MAAHKSGNKHVGKGKGIVGGSPSNSIAAKTGGQTFAKGGKGVGAKNGNTLGPRGKKL